MDEMAVENQGHSPFNFSHVVKNLGDHLKQSSLSLDDMKKLRFTNTNFDQITRATFLDKSNKSIVINSDDEMKEFLERCEQIAPDIVKCLAFGPEFLPDSYIRPKPRSKFWLGISAFIHDIVKSLTFGFEFLPASYLRPESMSKFCPGISVFIRDLTLCKYELPLDQLLETLGMDFPHLSILQLRLHNIDSTTLKEIPSITSLKLEFNLERDACTPGNLIPFLGSIFKTMPNIHHLDILDVPALCSSAWAVWDILIEQDFKALGLENLVSLHRQTPMYIRLRRSGTYGKYLRLKNYLYDLKLSISYRETDVSVEFINDFLRQMDTKITMLRFLDGVEEMIPPGFGAEIKHLVLKSFAGSIRFIENMRKLESVKLKGININTQLFNGTKGEDEAIAMAVFGRCGHPNFRYLKASVEDRKGNRSLNKLVRILKASKEGGELLKISLYRS